MLCVESARRNVSPSSRPRCDRVMHTPLGAEALASTLLTKTICYACPGRADSLMDTSVWAAHFPQQQFATSRGSEKHFFSIVNSGAFRTLAV